MKNKVADRRPSKAATQKKRAVNRPPVKNQRPVRAVSSINPAKAVSPVKSETAGAVGNPVRRISSLDYFALTLACASGLAVWATAFYE
jgi:hypothetical protein